MTEGLESQGSPGFQVDERRRTRRSVFRSQNKGSLSHAPQEEGRQHMLEVLEENHVLGSSSVCNTDAYPVGVAVLETCLERGFVGESDFCASVEMSPLVQEWGW